MFARRFRLARLCFRRPRLVCAGQRDKRSSVWPSGRPAGACAAFGHDSRRRLRGEIRNSGGRFNSSVSRQLSCITRPAGHPDGFARARASCAAKVTGRDLSSSSSLAAGAASARFRPAGAPSEPMEREGRPGRGITCARRPICSCYLAGPSARLSAGRRVLPVARRQGHGSARPARAGQASRERLN